MRCHTSRLDDLVLQIHASVLDSSAWGQVLDQMRGLTGADKALLHNPRPQSPQDYWCHPIGLDVRNFEQYATHWVARDLWARGWHERGKNVPGTVVLDDDLVERRVFRESAFFNDYIRGNDIDRMMATCLRGAPSGRSSEEVVLSLFRARSERPFSHSEVALVQRVTPHLVIAVRNYWRYRSLSRESLGLRGLLDFVSVPLFGLDHFGHVVFINAVGEAELRHGRWVRVSGSQLKAAAGVVEERRLARLVRDVRHGIGGSIVLREQRANASAILSMAPITLPMGTTHSAGGLAALAWLQRPERASVSVMAQLFGLTQAEERVVRLLCQGRSLSEIACERQLSVHTLRNQLKAVYRKTGQGSQAKVVALAMRSGLIQMPK